MDFDIEKHTVLKVVAGSHAYGTNTPESDEDFRGIIVPPLSYFFGLKRFEQFAPEANDANDIVLYDIRKFFQLALQGNPAVLEILQAPRLICKISPIRICQIWHAVISKHIVKPHLGMAQAQLIRITKLGRNCGIKERDRDSIEKFGYNTKDACHVIRVLGQCIEILETGDLTLPRPENIFLLNIKNGLYSLEFIQREAEERIQKIKRLEVESKLPALPNYDFVNEYLVSFVPWILENL